MYALQERKEVRAAHSYAVEAVKAILYARDRLVRWLFPECIDVSQFASLVTLMLLASRIGKDLLVTYYIVRLYCLADAATAGFRLQNAPFNTLVWSNTREKSCLQTNMKMVLQSKVSCM
jgi:hypothetical protein